MDYVVFGIGFGATILVLGLLLRDFGPKLRFRRSRDGGDVLGAEELVAKVSWTRYCTALGTVLALAGAAFLIITLASMILVVSDDTGLWVMSGAYGLLLVVMAYWTWAYFHRFGSYGILPERVEPDPAFSAPRSTSKPVTSGPPAPTSGNDSDEPESDEVEPQTGEDELGAEPVAPEEGDQPAPEVDEEAVETAPRLQTPEERLARAESPIDHGSAEGDLDLAASGRRRPGAFASRHVEDEPNPSEASDSDETDADADEDRTDA